MTDTTLMPIRARALATGLALAMACFLAGCMNMPTKPAQITGIPASGAAYKGWDCDQLLLEYDHLRDREQTLVIAQEQRYKTSEQQAFWYGYGQGDGIEASELARVRGELVALEKLIDQKRCK